MKSTQLIILVIFIAFTLLGVLVFAGIIPSPGSTSQSATRGNLLVWGTVPSEAIVTSLKSKETSSLKIQYQEHLADTFMNDLLEAIASGIGPDLVIFPDNLTLRLAPKIEPFPVATYDERTFRDTFIQEGELFIGSKGVLALPIALDPLVMYWNRNMFFNRNVPNPPLYWDEFLTLSPTLTERSDANDILKSALAFGEWKNITHAKDILALLTLQIGNPITSRQGASVVPTLVTVVASTALPPVDEVFRFYTDFADPVKSIYSWNRSLPESKNAFLSQDLAVYFGYASELPDIQTKNPNLNFDIASVPQVRNYTFKKTFGRMTGVAVMKTSAQKPAAFFMATFLSSPEFEKVLSTAVHTSPVRRASLVTAPTNDPYKKILYEAALNSGSWLDPNPEKTDEIFQFAIESIVSGKARIGSAVGTMQAKLGLLLK